MDLETILFIVSGVMAVAAAVLGTKWDFAKKKITQVGAVGKEAVDVAQTAIAALEDNKITKEETDEIVKEAKELAAAFKTLIGK